MAYTAPPAPTLSGTAVLEVFTHHSVAPTTMAEPFGNAANLRVLGAPMLKMAYMAALTEKRPSMNGVQFEQYVDVNYPDFLAHWVNVYGWRARVRMTAPPDVDLNDPEETRIIFETYAGAVVKEYQPNPEDRMGVASDLLKWIRDLVYISD